MQNFIGVTADGNDRLDTCPSWCAGHMDDSTYHLHETPFDYFGLHSPVIVTQTDGEPPKVAIVDLPHPQANFTWNEARLLGFQLLLAADVAERAARPTITAEVTQALAVALASIGIS